MTTTIDEILLDRIKNNDPLLTNLSLQLTEGLSWCHLFYILNNTKIQILTITNSITDYDQYYYIFSHSKAAKLCIYDNNITDNHLINITNNPYINSLAIKSNTLTAIGIRAILQNKNITQLELRKVFNYDDEQPNVEVPQSIASEFSRADHLIDLHVINCYDIK